MRVDWSTYHVFRQLSIDDEPSTLGTYTASDAAGELPDSREASNVSVGGVEYALHSAIKRTTSRAICSFYFYFAVNGRSDNQARRWTL